MPGFEDRLEKQRQALAEQQLKETKQREAAEADSQAKKAEEAEARRQMETEIKQDPRWQYLWQVANDPELKQALQTLWMSFGITTTSARVERQVRGLFQNKTVKEYVQKPIAFDSVLEIKPFFYKSDLLPVGYIDIKLQYDEDRALTLKLVWQEKPQARFSIEINPVAESVNLGKLPKSEEFFSLESLLDFIASFLVKNQILLTWVNNYPNSGW